MWHKRIKDVNEEIDDVADDVDDAADDTIDAYAMADELKERKSDRRKHLAKGICLFLFKVAFIGVFTFSITMNYSNRLKEQYRTAIGETAVKYLYNFNSVEQLAANMPNLQDITTEEVYNQLTIDNEGRTLNTYLKFKNDACTVDVIKSTSSYVLYNILNDNIDQDRIFIFTYHVNDSGKIDYAREEECIDFVDYIDIDN